jgi:S1-C subfamily serine protease
MGLATNFFSTNIDEQKKVAMTTDMRKSIGRPGVSLLGLLALLLVWQAWNPVHAELLTCPDCDHKVSSHAAACPNCGCPIDKIRGEEPDKEVEPAPDQDEGKHERSPASIPVVVYDSGEHGFLRTPGVKWACNNGLMREVTGDLVITPTNQHVVLSCNVAELVTGDHIEIKVQLKSPRQKWHLYSLCGKKGKREETIPEYFSEPFPISFQIDRNVDKGDLIGFRMEFKEAKKPLHVKSVVVRSAGQLNRDGVITGYTVEPVTGAAVGSGAFVLIETEKGGRGSGFVTRMGGKRYVVSNQHVIMGSRAFTVRTSSGQRIRLTSMEVARNGDLVRFLYQEDPAVTITPLSAAEAVPDIGKPLAVYGNSMGAGAVTRLDGTVLGVGPDRVEVSARFVPGNSGSPILDGDGSAFAVATYLQQMGSDSDIYEGTRFNEVRRFGYLITPNVQWIKVSPKTYYRQTAQLSDVATYYDEVAHAISNLSYYYFLKQRNRYSSAVYKTGQTRTYVRGKYSRDEAKTHYNDDAWSDYMANFYNVYGAKKKQPKTADSPQSIERYNRALVLQLKNMVGKGENALVRRRWSSGFLKERADQLDEYAKAIKKHLDAMME